MGKSKKKKDKKKSKAKKKGMLAAAMNAVSGVVSDPGGSARSAANAVTGGSATVGAIELAALAAGLTALLSASGEKGEPSVLKRVQDIVDDRVRQVLGSEGSSSGRRTRVSAAKRPAGSKKGASRTLKGSRKKASSAQSDDSSGSS